MVILTDGLFAELPAAASALRVAIEYGVNISLIAHSRCSPFPPLLFFLFVDAREMFWNGFDTQESALVERQHGHVELEMLLRRRRTRFLNFVGLTASLKEVGDPSSGQLGDAFRAAAVHSLARFNKDQSRKALDTVRINAESDRLLTIRAVVIIITTWPGN